VIEAKEERCAVTWYSLVSGDDCCAPASTQYITCHCLLMLFRRDPFIMESTPHVFFAGNQPEFATRIAKGK
jgi:hypothetical protein